MRFRQLRGGAGGLFGLDPENRVTVIGSILNLLPIIVRMILVNTQNLTLLAFLLLEMTSKKISFPEGNESSQFDFTPWNRTKLDKRITFYA